MGMNAEMIDADLLPVQITGLGICGDELVYGVNLEGVGSVYHRSFDPSDDSEGLVRASNEFVFGSFDCKGDQLAVSMGANTNSLHIGVMDIKGRYNEYTDGDTIEENPSWAAKKNGIYFSTAGYARNQYGAVAATGPRAVDTLILIIPLCQKLLLMRLTTTCIRRRIRTVCFTTYVSLMAVKSLKAELPSRTYSSPLFEL